MKAITIHRHLKEIFYGIVPHGIPSIFIYPRPATPILTNHLQIPPILFVFLTADFELIRLNYLYVE